MNLRLDVVVNDICGLTGLKIIDAICKGESDPNILAAYRHGNCRKSSEEIAKALQSNGRKDYLFALQQEFQIFSELSNKIILCDEQISLFIDKVLDKKPEYKKLETTKKVHKKVNKNAPKNFDLKDFAYRLSIRNHIRQFNFNISQLGIGITNDCNNQYHNSHK